MRLTPPKASLKDVFSASNSLFLLCSWLIVAMRDLTSGSGSTIGDFEGAARVELVGSDEPDAPTGLGPGGMAMAA